MKFTRTLKLHTYSCKLELIVTDQLKAEVARVYKKHKIPEEFEIEAEGVLISPAQDHYYLVIDPQYLTHNTIAHEVYHAVVRITEDRGIVDEEAQAWLAGHITEEFYKFSEKKKLTIKHHGN